MANNVKESEIKFRCSLDQKEEYKKCADEAGLSLSDFIRSLLSGEEKLVLLSEGSEIAKNLFLIHNDLEYFRSNGGVPTESLNAMLSALDDVSTKLNEVVTHLTDIHADNGEDNDE